MEHNYRFPVLKVKMITPNDENYTYLKTLPQVESKVNDNSKRGDKLNWGIDLAVAEEVVEIAVQTIDYINGYTNPKEFVFQIVDECVTGENPDMVYYTYSHNKGCFIKA